MHSPARPVPDPHPRPGEHREVEWQLAVADLEAVEAWLLRHPWPEHSAEASGAVELRDAYYDSDDWRIHRAGYCLRIRDAGGTVEATLKALVPADPDGLARRLEIAEGLPYAERDALRVAEGPVAERVRDLLGPTPLRLLFRVRTHRRLFVIHDHRGAIGEVALDETEISGAPRLPPERLRRVEIEARDPGAETLPALRSFVTRMRTQCALEPTTCSKYEAGIVAAGMAPPQPLELGPVEVHPSMGIGEVAFAVLRRQLLALLAHESGTRLGDDPENLHDMRVAIRRLRAALRLFEPYLPARASRLRAGLKGLGRVLGAVRDLDVQTAELAAFARKLGEEGRAAEPLLARLHAIRAKRRAEMLKTLDAPRTRRLLAATQAMLRRSPPTYTRADRLPAVVVLPSLIRKRYQKLRKAADRIDERAPAAAYHEVRIRGKRLRYAIEFADGLYGESGRPAVRSLVRLQDLLGAHQDAQVGVEQLRAMALQGEKRLPAGTLFLMGRMAESAESAARRMRNAFPRAYRRLRGRRWSRYRRAQERAQLRGLLLARHAAVFEQHPPIVSLGERGQEL